MPSAAPSIRGFQLDATSVGDVKSNVNLFRGDVNLSQPLFTMPGRSSDQALDVNVGLLYQSNVTLQAWSWNHSQPTGTLGLGWSLPLERIELESGITPEGRQYQLVTSGSGATLVPEPEPPTLFSLSTDAAAGLQDGATVPAGLVSGFAGMGTVLSTSTVASLQADGSWLLADDDQQRLFRLSLGDAAVVQEGGQSFQLQSYSFWRIIYYARYERWSITDDSGVVKSYGGLVPGSLPTGRGNSIAWSVLWSRDGSTPTWQGPSTSTTGQVRSARAWYLESVRDLWGDVVSYAYNPWEPVDGVIPVVEQRVGSETGLPYTKAVYLGSITDVFGRRAVFTYGDKLWSNDDDRAREYADPHKPTPDDSPNAWQDRYETRYLADISVVDTDGSELFGVAFDYAPSPDSADPAVVNLTQATGRLAGDCAKRLLTSITARGADGRTRPATKFTYYTDSSAEGYAPGALASLTTPGGAVASYTYVAQELDVCQRDVVATGPEDTTVAMDSPRVWFGSDYAVVAWAASSPSRLSLQVYTWQGRWIPTYGAPQTLTSSTFLIDTLKVVCSQDSFSVSVQSGDACSVYLFSRDPARPWSFAPVAPDGSLGDDAGSPTLLATLQVPAASLCHLAGEGFLLVGNQAASGVSSSLIRYTWSFTERSWQRSSHPGLTTGPFWLTVGSSWYFLIDGTGSATLTWVDAAGTWTSGATVSKPAWWPGSVNLSTPLTLTAGEAMVALAYLSGTGTSPQLGLAIYQWDTHHTVTRSADGSLLKGSLPISAVSPPLGTPVVVEDTIVALGPWVWRFDGGSWVLNQALYRPQTTGSVRYAHGAALSLCVSLSSSDTSPPVVSALAYDGSDWSKLAAFTPSTPLPSASGPSPSVQGWPNVGDDWTLIGRQLYFRGNASSWSTALRAAPTDLQSLLNDTGSNRYLVNTQTLVNQGPMFLAFDIEDTQSASSASAWTLGVAPLVNGSILGGAPVQLTSDRLSDGGNGEPTAGPSTLCTFPAGTADFAHALSVTLRRYAGNSLSADPSTPTAQLSGNIQHYAVASFSVDDGLSQHSTCIIADPSSAACDASGTIAKYYATTVQPGTDDDDAPYGSVLSTYINGIGGKSAASDVMLDGLLEQVETRDPNDATLSTVSMGWTVYRQRATSPGNPQAPVLNLYGGFVTRTSVTRETDGVTSSRGSDYVQDGFSAPWSSQVTSSTSTQVGSTGTLETTTTLTTGAATVSPLHAALNMLTARAMQTTTWQSNNGPQVTTRASASTASAATNQLGVRVPVQLASYAWNGTGEVSPPWEQSTNLDTWATIGTVIHRDEYGLVTEYVDAGGVSNSTRRSTQASLPLAGCNGAALDRWRVNTFEDDDPGEGFSSTGASWSDDCWMGTRSLSLAPGGTLEASLPADPGTLAWSGWIRAASGATLELQATADGASLSTQSLTGRGAWQHVLVPLNLESSAATLTVTLTNSSSTTILVDMVAVAPRSAGLVMQTVDAASRQVTAQASLGGVTTRNHLSADGVQVGQSGPEEALLSWTLNGLSRRASAADDFQASHPNALWTLQPARGGRLEDFRRGDDWSQRWVPAEGTTCSRQDGALLLSGSIAAKVVGDGFAVVAEVRPQGSGWMGFRLGALSLGWDEGWSWPGGPSPVCTPDEPGTQWMLIVSDGQLVLVVDGLLVFSGAFDASALDEVILDTGSNTALVRNLGLLHGPRLTVRWQDGTTQDRQIQQRWASDARVSQIIRDALGRTVANTRMAPGSFGSGASLPQLAYRPGFVDEAAFLATLGSTWEMSGDVADYYSAEDGAFPYSGTRYEASPRNRRLEQGAPGAAQAITQVDTTSIEERSTQSWTYGSTTVGEGLVQQRTARSPLGRQSQTARTGPRSVISAQSLDTSSIPTGRTAQVVTYASADDGGVSTTLRQTPNGGGDGVPASGDAYVGSSVVDPLGRQLRITDPDSGTTRFWYTGDGQVRFAAPALDDGESGLVYQRYDARGRLIETGTVDEAVDDTTLAAELDDMSWPDASVSHTVVRTWSWDGDGTRPFELGNTTEITTTLPAPEGFAEPATVKESFSHDASGRVVRATLEIMADSSYEATVGYVYDAQGELVALRFPEGSPIEAVFYGYDDQGRVLTIGSTPGADDIARYVYTPDGPVLTELRGNGTIGGTMSWTGSGWSLGQRLVVGDSTVWDLQLAREADGSVSGFTEQWAGEDAVQYTCTYDGNGRLTRCQPESGDGDEQINTYDANGNVLDARLDDAAMTATLAGASNRLDTVTVGDTSSSVSTSAAGNVSTWGDYTATTDRCLGRVTRATRGSTVVRLAYGAQGRRTLRQVAGGSTRFVHYGAGGVPLLWNENGATSVAVWGPTGLVMVADASGRYFPVCDSQHTVRGLLDASGAVVARWRWSAFGGLVASSGETSRSWLGFQGQEWDADLGVHDFGARLYDPTLRRFLAPDPARQFSSPYVFLGGNPLQNVDPSGQASAASIAVGATTVAIAAVTVAGLALSVFTFGVSDAAAASVDATLMSTEALEVGADLGADLGEVVLEESLEEGLEETTDLLLEDTEETLSTSSEGSAESAPTGSEGARELEAGPETGGSGKSAAKASTEVGSATRSPANKVLRKLGSEALKGGSRSALRSGIAYNVQGIRGDDWSMKGLLASLGKGFGAGAIYGLTCGAMELGLERVIPGASSFNKVGKACISAAASTMANVACKDVNQMVTNVINGDPFYSQLGRATVGGTVSGVASWAACEAITATIGAPAAYTTAVAVTVVTTGAVPNQTDSSTSMSGS